MLETNQTQNEKKRTKKNILMLWLFDSFNSCNLSRYLFLGTLHSVVKYTIYLLLWISYFSDKSSLCYYYTINFKYDEDDDVVY